MNTRSLASKVDGWYFSVQFVWWLWAIWTTDWQFTCAWSLHWQWPKAAVPVCVHPLALNPSTATCAWLCPVTFFIIIIIIFCLFNWAHYFLDSRKISTALGLVAPRWLGHPSHWQLPWPNSRNQPINQPLHLQSSVTFWELAEHSLCLTVHSHLVHGFPGVRRVLGPPRGPGSAAPVPDVRLS